MQMHTTYFYRKVLKIILRWLIQHLSITLLQYIFSIPLQHKTKFSLVTSLQTNTLHTPHFAHYAMGCTSAKP